MNIAILGSTGMLGSTVSGVLCNEYGNKNVALGVRNINKARNEHKNILFDALFNPIELPEKYDYVINCIGIIIPYVKDLGVLTTLQINSIFPHKLAGYCKEVGSKLINITTDCVFSGRKGNYIETDEHDATDIYGKSKSLGESENCMNLRTSIIGEEQYNKVSLIEWIKSQKGKEVKGFTNHFWNGVTTKQYTKILIQIIENDLYENGIFHVFSPQRVSKKELVEMISRKFDLGIKVNPFETEVAIDRTLSTIKSLNSKLFIPNLQQQIEEM
jgi:dTDP-4-dehydrorhamnose reductase